MKGKSFEVRTTRTSDLAGAAFYYAHGLRFKTLELGSGDGSGGALNINVVFTGGPELTVLADEFQSGNPEVTLEDIRAFVEVLHRRLGRGAMRDEVESGGGL